MSPEAPALVLVVGPSGAGKDTLINLAARHFADDRRVTFVRRVVTRTADASEDHDTMDETEFSAAQARGEFALSWQAHGLSYGVPVAALEGVEVAVCNVSRAVIFEARRGFAAVSVVYVTAPPEILAARLAARGRETGIADRLARKIEHDPLADADLVIDNRATPQAGAEPLIAHVLGRLRDDGRDRQAAL